MLTKKKNFWTPEAQTGTWKNNRQSKKYGGEIKKNTTTTSTQCYVLLRKFIKGCTSYNPYYCKGTPQCVGVSPLF